MKKSNVAEAAGYQCIHIFDWDDLTKLIKMLSPKQTIYARKCAVQKIDTRTASLFLNEYHLQGRSNGVKCAYGLYYNNELVEVMTFGEPRYNQKYEWELLRLCIRCNYNVTGGASRLLKAFIREFHPSSLISYCDRAKFRGDVYLKLGFHLDHVSPSCQGMVVWR